MVTVAWRGIELPFSVTSPSAPVAESAECYTVRCQGERLEQRLARREQVEARLSAERTAATPRTPKGLPPR